jgi:Tol biopolymer transport system component
MSLTTPARLALIALTLALGLVVLRAFPASAAPAASASASGLIAFESDRPDPINPASDVFTMAADGSSVTQLTNSGNEPAWNADGTKIAFSTNHNYGDPRACLRNIFTMNADGTGVTWILGGEGCSSPATTSCSFSNFPSWSPDGTKIVYAGNDCVENGVRVPGGIFVVELATRARTRLTTNRVGFALDADPSWSHDGTKIAFSRAEPDGYHVYVVDPNGENLAQLDSLPGGSPAWSPDDSKIAFISARDSNFEIWVMDADGTDPVQLTHTSGATNLSPSWSPDGAKIAFASNRDPSPNGTSDYEVWTMNADGSSQTQITDHAYNDLRPSWQPTGGSPPPPPPPPPPTTGTIRIELDTVPDDEQPFQFQGTGPPNTLVTPFTLDDDGGSDGTNDAFQEFPDVVTGSWSFSPYIPPPDWIVTALTCTDPDGGSSTNVTTGVVSIDLDPGETVTCKYTYMRDTAPPTLTLPANPVVDATSPAGATVNYTASASDNLDPSPTVACVPPSGSVFPIGPTTVNCTATDDAGNSAQGSFTVTVRGAGAQIALLIAKTDAFVDSPLIERALKATLQAASQALATGRRPVACAAMAAYIVAVRALPARYLTTAQKAALIADATRIRAVIGC